MSLRSTVTAKSCVRGQPGCVFWAVLWVFLEGASPGTETSTSTLTWLGGGGGLTLPPPKPLSATPLLADELGVPRDRKPAGRGGVLGPQPLHVPPRHPHPLPPAPLGFLGVPSLAWCFHGEHRVALLQVACGWSPHSASGRTSAPSVIPLRSAPLVPGLHSHLGQTKGHGPSCPGPSGPQRRALVRV